jgi:hypothetical protein
MIRSIQDLCIIGGIPFCPLLKRKLLNPEAKLTVPISPYSEIRRIGGAMYRGEPVGVVQ